MGICINTLWSDTNIQVVTKEINIIQTTLPIFIIKVMRCPKCGQIGTVTEENNVFRYCKNCKDKFGIIWD